MKTVPSIDIFEAAAYALVNDRCCPAYLHDVRGGLHALHSAVELLIRAATLPGDKSDLTEKASALARHAVLNHEKLLVELMNQIAPPREVPSAVNIGELVSNVLRFLRNDVAKKFVTFRSECAHDVFIEAPAYKLRLLILGLCSTLADELAPGVIEVRVSRLDLRALIEFRPSAPRTSVMRLDELWRSDDGMASPYELLLSLTRRWAHDNGGEFELTTDSHLQGALRLLYPLSSATKRTST